MDRIPLIITSSRPEALQQAREAILRDNAANVVTRELPIIDGFAAELDPSSLAHLDQLHAFGDEVLVAPDQEMSLPPERHAAPPPSARLSTARATLHVEDVWSQGFKGKGVGIAIVDTGIAPHPDLKDRVVAFHDSVNERSAMYDDHGHGSHVSGIAAGDGSQSSGRYKGMAPEASLIGIKVLNDKGRGKTSDIVEGIGWAVENKQRYNIRAMNISIGGKAWISAGFDPLARAVTRAVNAGIFVAVAAGNSGPDPKTVETPGISSEACTVGNLDQHWSSARGDDTIADSSSRGPTKYDDYLKPEVCAPGTWITSCDKDNGYVSMSGTSMATPMVAGTAALLIQAKPSLTPYDVKSAFMLSAAPLADVPASAQGVGMIDPPQALASIK